MNAYDVVESHPVDEPESDDVDELSDALDVDKSEATKLIKAATILRDFYERECSLPMASQMHKFSKKRLKEYIESVLNDADLVAYFNGDPRGPSVKVMEKPNDGEINPHKPWKYAPTNWPFVIAMSKEAFIPTIH